MYDLASSQNWRILIFCSGVNTIPTGNWYFYHIKWQNVVIAAIYFLGKLMKADFLLIYFRE